MTAKQSLALRIGLDCTLIAICATLFSKNVISLMYHEVVGLVLLILFVAHVIFNRKWVSRVFSGKMKTGRSKATLVVNGLLILSWICVMVTGILVSKKLFPFQIRKYRIIEWFSSGGNFSRLRTARIEGYLVGNQDSCRQQAADIHSLMSREHCAVFPWITLC